MHGYNTVSTGGGCVQGLATALAAPQPTCGKSEPAGNVSDDAPSMMFVCRLVGWCGFGFLQRAAKLSQSIVVLYSLL